MKKTKRNQKRKPDIRYVTCRDHKKRRWSIVCIHLAEGMSREWNVLKNGRGRPDDYLCPECLKDQDRIFLEHDLVNLRPVCVMCVERIRVRFDPNYQSLS